MSKKINKKRINFESGIALVETIAALGVAVVVITALVSLSISTLRTSLNSKLLLEGSDKANKEIELVRAYRDSVISWDVFINGGTGFNAIKNCTPLNPCSMDSIPSVISHETTENSGKPDQITRSFTATNPTTGADILDTDQIVRISVSVTWTVGDENKGAYLYTDLTNWRPQ